MNQGGFEEFTGRHVPASRLVPRVAIQRGGAFSMNLAAVKLLGEPKFVVLLFDRERRLIGMRVAREDVPYAYPVRKQKGSPSYLVSGKSFLAHCGIKYGDKVLSFHPHMEGDVLVVKLDEGGNEIEGT